MKCVRIGRLICLVVAMFVPIVLATAVANAADWIAVPSPNPGVSGNELNGVTVVTRNDVWAVGDITVAGGASQTLIEQWNGATWSVVPSPSPSTSHNILRGVASVAANDVWAVGYFNDS